MSILNPPELSGWLIVKMVARVLGLAILAMVRIPTGPKAKRKPDAAQFRVACGKWEARMTIRASVPRRSRSSRSATQRMADPNSLYTGTTLEETDRRVGDASSLTEQPAA